MNFNIFSISFKTSYGDYLIYNLNLNMKTIKPSGFFNQIFSKVSTFELFVQIIASLIAGLIAGLFIVFYYHQSFIPNFIIVSTKMAGVVLTIATLNNFIRAIIDLMKKDKTSTRSFLFFVITLILSIVAFSIV